MSRKKLTFFFDIVLFYGRLSLLFSDIDRKIDGIMDIVEELDDETPTIIDFDSSQHDLLSLKQALIKSDKFLDEIIEV